MYPEIETNADLFSSPSQVYDEAEAGGNEMLIGSIKKFLKGGLSPAHVWSSVVLGVLLGMIPDYGASVGWAFILLLSASLVRVNTGLLALSFILAKTILLVSLPWVFNLGHATLHGAIGTVFVNLSQLPLIAWFGFERYAMVGALVMALPVSLLLAFVVNLGVQKMRHAGANLQASPRFDAFVQSFLGRTALTLMLGKSAKEGLGSALNRTVPLFRLKESVIITSLIVLLALGLWQWAKTGLKDALVPVLERANGATVDVERLSLDLWSGAVEVVGLEVADASNLEVNVFAASELRVSVSSLAFLSKQIVIDEVTAQQASSGMPRTQPGELVGPLIVPTAITAPSADEVGNYLEEAELWLERLKQVQAWLKRWEGRIPDGPQTKPELGSPSYEDWLKEQIAQSGYTGLSFAAIEDRYWSALARTVSVDSIHISAIDDKNLTLLAQNLGSDPELQEISPRIEVSSDDESVNMLVQLDELSGVGANRIELSFEGLDAQSTLSSLKPSIAKRVTGGQINLNVNGAFRYADEGELNLDMLATLRDSELVIQRRNVPVSEFKVPVFVQGSFKAPKIRVDNKALEDQLKHIATDALKDEAKSKVEEKIKDKLGDRLKGLFK